MISDAEKQLLISIVNNSDQISDDLKTRFAQSVNESRTKGDLLKTVADIFRIGGGLSDLIELFLD